MADTIVNTPGNNNDGGSAGWVVALVVIIALVVGGIVLYQNGFFSGGEKTPGTTNINVTVPNPVTPNATGDASTQ
ncbi:MAG: hypothetical protein V4449_03645 [Patescibacteria group bacterium]